MKVSVIGSGVAGLATAARLASKGFEVNVYEKNSYPGGKLSFFQQGDYRFDAGPSLFTMPQLLEQCILDCGEQAQDYFEYQKIEIACNYFFSDGTRLNAHSDAEKFAEEIEEKLGTPSKLIIDHLKKSEFLFNKTHKLFLESSLHKWKTYFNKDVLGALANVHKLQLNQSMHEVNKQRFEDPRLVQLFDRFATYNGSDPYKAPGVLNIIPHLEHNIGTFFPKGGMHSITQALVDLGKKKGVQFHFNSGVDSIITEGKKIKGIEIDKEFIESDIVVSNSDVYPTYKHLLKDQKAPGKILEQERSSSAIIFYWGIKREFPELDLHNIFFSGDYKNEFKHIFDLNDLNDDPTVYVNISSKFEESDAPEGCENWFVMINAPSNQGQDWDELIRKSRLNILKKLSQSLGQEIEPLIENESILDPRSIESKTSSFGGALYGSSSNNKMAAFLRHPNFSQNIKGLYFCGGSVHPGGGIPLCLLSAKITSELIA